MSERENIGVGGKTFSSPCASPIKTYVITHDREISVQRPFPSVARPWRKARCSSEVHGEPRVIVVAFAVSDAAPPPPAAVCIIGAGASASCCAASRAGVIGLGDFGRDLHVIARA